MTFGDMAMCFTDDIPKRECAYDFPSWSVERMPTKEEKKNNPNVICFIEQQVFFYRPFIVSDIDGNEVTRL
ncbi:hypothetical protein LCGC14_2382450 [marine sediment metagenome]|uniref:Uncharacterized protein n=1 Tax=marine sediment metagenome TaxID=412755 RepID=A0A0F9C0P0_9ZZZZ